MKKSSITFIAIIFLLLASIGCASGNNSSTGEQLTNQISVVEETNTKSQEDIATSEAAVLLEQAQTHYNNQEYRQAKEIADSICTEYPDTSVSNDASLLSINAQTELDKIEQQRIEEEKRIQEQQAQEAALLAQQQAQSEATTYSAPVENTVYIAASGNGTKYHSNPNCSNMKGTVSLSLSTAQARGYEPCKKCY